MNDERDLTLIIRSRFPVIVVETHEEARVMALLERVARLEGQGLFVWTAADGLQRRDNPLAASPGSYSTSGVQKGPYGKGPIADTLHIGGVLKHVYATSFNGIYALVDVHPYLEDPVNQRHIKSIAQEYDKNPRTLVLIGSKITLADDLQRMSARFELRLPDAAAMRELMESESRNAIRFGVISPADEAEAVSLISQHLVGLCIEDARRLVRQCLTDDGQITTQDVARVLKAKQDKLGANGVVQMEMDTTQFSDVAGLANLKRWLTQRRAAFTGDAAALGLDPPKGVLLLGVQGGGKSLAAKAVAGAWHLPLLRLDFGALYDKWLGETERKLREALKFADTMSPCVLWMDEIEKGVASGGASDGGESRRVLGTILTWMSERKSKVFMVATANDIQQLPPELIRKGRFDEIFFVDLPDVTTRAEIFKLHIARRKLDATKFDLAKLAGASDGFSGAEIEQAIVSGLYEAHASGKPLNTIHVLEEIVRTRPLSVVMAEKISALREWAAAPCWRIEAIKRKYLFIKDNFVSILDQDQLGAFCRHTHVELPGTATGTLAGLSFGLKDIFDIAGHKTGFGSPDWLRTHDAAKAHSHVAKKLLDAGASLAGKTHTEEMAFSLTGENAHYGTPINVAAPDRVPGGSSSGSAAAVAGNLVDFAIGSDTGGSVRGPASFCGIYGIRPTHGRISLAGVCPLAPGFDTCGWFARDATLLARVGDVLLGGKTATPGRILLAQDAFALAMPGAQHALQPALERVTKVLGNAEAVTVSSEGLNEWFDVFRILQFAEIWNTHREWVTRVQPKFGPAIGKRFEAVAKVTPAEVAQMTPRREEITARLDKLLANNAIMLLPSVPDIAPLKNCPHEQTTAFRERAMGMLCISGIGRLPQVSLPLATLNGCPLGLSLIAARGNDEMLLAVAKQIV